MFMLKESIPDTLDFMIAGYAIAFTVMAIYLASLVIRWRNLIQDLQAIESIQKASRPKAGKSKAGASRKPPRKKNRAKPVGRKKK
jgi:hypothetical protein